MYSDHPISKQCMESVETRYTTLDNTYLAWTEINFLNPGFTKYDNETGEAIYNIYSEPVD